MIAFTSHNIRLDNGAFTMPKKKGCLEDQSIFKSYRNLLNVIFPGDKSKYCIADLGCLEGGFSVAFARMGFNVVGIEARSSNINNCLYVKENIDLPNLKFIHDNVLNIEKYGCFDCVFCSGLLYHLNFPYKFLKTLSSVTEKLLILNTHFAPENNMSKHIAETYRLQDLVSHEGLDGRWYTEFVSELDFKNRENKKWASWDNKASFWITHSNLLHAIHDVGFTTVMQQFDFLAPDIGKGIKFEDNYYQKNSRGIFVGLKS